jgi:hypothetical protein
MGYISPCSVHRRIEEMFNIGRDWPVYFFVGVTILFLIYIGYRNHKVDREKKGMK